MPVEITNLDGLPRDGSAPRHMTSPDLVRRLDELLLARMLPAIGELGRVVPDEAAAIVRDGLVRFRRFYDSRPVQDNSGGSGLNDSLWIYLMARLLRPALIVESGVHKGHSTWLFRQASPDAVIISFDISFKNLVYRDEKASYFETDWMDQAVAADTADGTALVFFDDHISHAERLIQAQVRGFNLALFDDNFPAHNLYATGGPPVPTLAMIMDESLDGELDIEWTRNGKLYRYLYDAAAFKDARAAVGRYQVLPDLANVTRYPAGSGLSFVEIAQKPEK